jgi:hypothetical protein
VREAALRALGRLDAGQGVATLLEALEDERARLAIYALRPALLALPAAEAIQRLQTVPLRKVTVAKEVVRLLGELPTEAAFGKLQELDGRKLHRDVRVALLRALWGHLERPEAWEILQRAAGSEDGALLTNAVRIPADRLSEPAQRRLVSFLARLLGHPAPEVRTQVLQHCLVLPLADPEQVLLPRFLQGLRSALSGERQAAARALFTAYTDEDAGAVTEGIRGLLDERRALRAVLGELVMWVQSIHRSRLLSLARAVLGVLATDPITAALRAELAVHALPWTELSEVLGEMASEGELHADALLAATAALSQRQTDPDGLETLETALAASREERLRRLAVTALEALARRPPGWNEDRLARLRLYRADRSPLVAAAAQFLLPVEEEQTEAT